MNYTIHTEPEYWGESIRALVRLYNGNPISNIKNEIMEKHKGQFSEEQIAPLLDDVDTLLARLGCALDLSDPKAELLLRNRGDCEELINSVFVRNRTETGAACSPAGSIAFVLDPEQQSCLSSFADDPTFFRWLDGQNLPTEDKYDAWKLCVNFASYETYALELIQRTTALLRDALPSVQPRINEVLQQFTAAVDESNYSFLGNPPAIRFDKTDYLHIYPVLFEPNALSVMYIDELGISDLCVGVSFFALSDMIDINCRRRDRLPEFLKVLADPTKLAILQKLRARKYFSGELAEALHLTGPTISHHMSVLVNLYLVTIEKAGTRIYYDQNEAVMQEYLDELQDTLCGKEQEIKG